MRERHRPRSQSYNDYLHMQHQIVIDKLYNRDYIRNIERAYKTHKKHERKKRAKKKTKTKKKTKQQRSRSKISTCTY